MIDELRARYMPRFLDAARLRLARGRQHLEAMSLGAIASDLHMLAGDAAMLDLKDLAAAARAGEAAARAVGASSSPDQLAACARALDRIALELDRLTLPPDLT